MNLAHCERCPIRSRFTHFPLVDSTFFKKIVGSRTLSYFLSNFVVFFFLKSSAMFRGTVAMSIPENTAGPVVGEACNARARKDRRAGLQGRKWIAAPQIPQA